MLQKELTHERPPRGAGSWFHVRERVLSDLWRRPDRNFAALDGMRGFASVSIVFYHCALFTGKLGPNAQVSVENDPLIALVSGLWSGIDIFFVLSGFLIGRLLIIDLTKLSTIQYRKFVIRRFCRIFPAYYLVLSISVFVVSRLEFPLYYYLYGTTDRELLVARSFTNYLYLNNYLNPGNEPGVLTWGWSLCVEEHFYLVLPPLLWAVFRYVKPRFQAWALGFCIVLPLVGRAVQYAVHPGRELMKGYYYYSHNRFDEIFVGVLIAYFYVLHQRALARMAERAGHLLWVFALLLGALVLVFGGLQKNTFATLVWQFSALALGSGCLLVNGLFLSNWATRFFSSSAWYPLARISYGTYLIHPFVLFGVLQLWLTNKTVHEIESPELVLVYFAVFGLSSLLAALMFLTLEAPLLRAGVRWARRYDSSKKAVTPETP